jgi:Holliday junction resolvase RusA-like endonuclease
MVESSAKVKPWREAVKHATREAMRDEPCLLGPLRVSMTFTLPKPKSAPKSRRTFPDKKPDLSKLIRSTEDALTDIAAWEDDARIVELKAAKRYPLEGHEALERPGVVISIERCL